MAKTSERMTISLRISPDLHAMVAKDAGGKSVNSEIVRRLQQSFEEEVPRSEFHFMDAIKKDVIPRARVTARIASAVADGVEAVDVVLIDEALAARIVARTGDERRVHDAAKAAIEAAFPIEGVTWGQLAEALAALGTKAPASSLAVREAIERRLAAAPAVAGQVIR